MSEAILSQDEMDALLKGVQSGQVDTLIAPSHMAGVRPYDLMNLNHYVTLNPMTAVKVVCEPFTISFQIALTKELRKEVKIAQPVIAMNKFDAFLEGISPGSNFNVVKIEPLTESVLLVLTMDLVYLLLEHFYGGGQKIQAKLREYTLIEKRFIRKIVDILLSEFQKAWLKVRSVQISILRSDSTSRTMKVLADKDWVVTSQFKIGIGEGLEQDFFFCFPFAHLEPLREKRYGSQGVESALQTRAEGQSLLQSLMEHGRLSVSVLVGCTTLTVPEMIKLEVGDVVMLDRGVHDDFELLVQNRSKFYGRPGKCKDKQAFQIRSIVPPKK